MPDARENSEVLLRYTSMATRAISEKMTTNAENVNMLFFMGLEVLGLTTLRSVQAVRTSS